MGIEDWRYHMTYASPFDAKHEQVKWFWEILRNMNEKQRLRTFEYITGFSKPPANGFAYLEPPCTLAPSSDSKMPKLDDSSKDQVPKGQQSKNTLLVPTYASKEDFA